MTGAPNPEGDDEAFWRDFLTRGDATERKVRRIFKLIPQGPRCKLCAAPFGGVGAPLMRMIGKRPSDKNPDMCNSCFAFMARHHGGAEIDAAAGVSGFARSAASSRVSVSRGPVTTFAPPGETPLRPG